MAMSADMSRIFQSTILESDSIAPGLFACLRSLLAVEMGTHGGYLHGYATFSNDQLRSCSITQKSN